MVQHRPNGKVVSSGNVTTIKQLLVGADRHSSSDSRSTSLPAEHPPTIPDEFPFPPALGENSSFQYDDDLPAAVKFAQLGNRLARSGDIFRRPEHGGGLLLGSENPNVPPTPILKAAQLACVITDRLRLQVVRNGKSSGSRISGTDLATMLGSEAFLQQFPIIDHVVQQPVFLHDFSLARPGYNDGVRGSRVLFTGKVPAIADNIETINRFLDVMAFAGNADRTNAVAAALTVMLRNHWPGAKPLLAVTASKSHAGKDTIIEFACGNTPHVSISYESTDWALQKSFVTTVKQYPDVGVINIENARLGRGDDEIASGFLERFLTTPEPDLQAIHSGPSVRIRNDKVIATSTNYGNLSTDLMNRGMPIHLDPVGNVADRESAIGNPRYEFLPANRDRIVTELLGMILRWKDAGMPLDTAVKHPFTAWAKPIGGILKLNGFENFLGNYSMRRTENDPLRRALALLGGSKPGRWQSSGDWVPLVAHLGLGKVLIPAADRESPESRRRGLGVVMSAHRGETFTAETDNKVLTLRLERARRRFADGHPETRYRFVVVADQDLPIDDLAIANDIDQPPLG